MTGLNITSAELKTNSGIMNFYAGSRFFSGINVTANLSVERTDGDRFTLFFPQQSVTIPVDLSLSSFNLIIGGVTTNYTTGQSTLLIDALSVLFRKVGGGTGGATTPVVADVTALSALSTTSLSAIVTDINQGGSFVYSGAALTADNALIFAKSGGGFWVRQRGTGKINMTWYGAIGSNFGAAFVDKTTQIQKFFLALIATKLNGYIPNEWYYASGKLVNNFVLGAQNRGLSLTGDSADNTRIYFYPVAAITAFELYDTQLTFEKFSIVGDNSNRIATGIKLGTVSPKDASRLILKEVNLSNLAVGVDCIETYIVDILRCYIVNNLTGVKLWQNIVNIRGGEFASNNIAIDYSVTGQNAAAYQLESTIDGVTIEGNQIGIKIRSSKRSININECYFENNSVADIQVGTDVGDSVDTVNINGGTFGEGCIVVFDRVKRVNIKGVSLRTISNFKFTSNVGSVYIDHPNPVLDINNNTSSPATLRNNIAYGSSDAPIFYTDFSEVADFAATAAEVFINRAQTISIVPLSGTMATSSGNNIHGTKSIKLTPTGGISSGVQPAGLSIRIKPAAITTPYACVKVNIFIQQSGNIGFESKMKIQNNFASVGLQNFHASRYSNAQSIAGYIGEWVTKYIYIDIAAARAISVADAGNYPPITDIYASFDILTNYTFGATENSSAANILYLGSVELYNTKVNGGNFTDEKHSLFNPLVLRPSEVTTKLLTISALADGNDLYNLTTDINGNVTRVLPVVIESLIGTSNDIYPGGLVVTGLANGSTQVASTGFVNKNLRISINGVPVYKTSTGGGENVQTKVLANNYVDFSGQLLNGDIIRIETI